MIMIRAQIAPDVSAAVRSGCRLAPLCEACGPPHHLAKGETLFLPQERAAHVYVVRDGVVGLFKIWENGDQNIVAVLPTGALFGLTALANLLGQGAPPERLYHARALTPASVCRIRREALRDALHARPTMVAQILGLAVDRIRDLQCFTAYPSRQQVDRRLLVLLLMLQEKLGEPSPHGVRIRARLSHEDLAQMISTTRPTITRLLLRFTREGLLSTDGRHLCLRNLAAIQRRLG
jgi:CRP/FNR family transcriptional regulator